MENSDSTDTYVLVSSGTFECPVEVDGSLALSTLQGQIPHANGLSYLSPETQRSRVIRFDKRLGKLFPPSDGWGQRIYNVSFANVNSHVCMRAPIAMDRYDRATRTFKESVDAVERLFDISYESEQHGENAINEKLKQEISRLRTKNKDLETDKRRLELDLEEKEKQFLSLQTKLADGREDNSEDLHSMNKTLMRLVQEKETEVSTFLKERDELQQQLDELKAEAHSQRQYNQDCTQDGMEQVSREDSAEETPWSQEKEMDEMKTQMEMLQSRWDEAKDKIEQLQRDLQQRDETLAAMEASKNELESQEEEMQQLKSASSVYATPFSGSVSEEHQTSTVSDLQNQLTGAQEKIGNLEDHIRKQHNLQEELNAARDDTQHAKFRLSEIEAQLSWKDAEVNNANRELTDRESKLTRVNQQMEEAKNRCQHLENILEKYRNREQAESEAFRRQNSEFDGSSPMTEGGNRVPPDEARLKVATLVEKFEKANQGLPNGESETYEVEHQSLQSAEASEESSEDMSELDKVAKRCKQMQSELTRLRESETRLNESLMSAKRELDDSRWRCGQLESMFMGGGGMSHSHLDESKQRMSELLQDISRFKRMHDEDSFKISQVEAEKAHEMWQLEEARRRCSELEGDLNHKNDRLRDTEHRIHQLDTRLNEICERYPFIEQNGPSEGQESTIVQVNYGQILHFGRVQNQLNDASNHIKWLEEQLAHYKHLFHDTGARVNHLQGILDGAHRYLWDSFVIRKEPFIDRNRWKLSMWYEGTQEHYVRVWYELDAPKAKTVYLATSYYNWEILLLCSWHEHQKWGVWVDAPKGRHEFSFLVDGEWKFSDQYPNCYNDMGSQNNYREVE